MGAAVVHFEIMGGEGNELEIFYRELFGWKIDSNNPMKYGVVETGGGPEGINGGVSPAKDGNKRVSIYVRVGDLQATLDRAERLGGKTILPPSEVPGGPQLAMFADPAGNITGFFWGSDSTTDLIANLFAVIDHECLHALAGATSCERGSGAALAATRTPATKSVKASDQPLKPALSPSVLSIAKSVSSGVSVLAALANMAIAEF